MKKKCSYNELVNLKNVINNLLSSKNSNGTKNQFNKVLVFNLRKNILRINEAIEILEDDEVYNQDNEKYDEYLKELFSTGKKHGVDFRQGDGGMFYIANQGEVDMDTYLEDKRKLDEEYEEVIQKQNKIIQEINEFNSEKNAEVELEKVDFDLFPDTLTEDQLPLEIVELIEMK